jgi:murein L,D-transpeptidase YcbB/YkuD
METMATSHSLRSTSINPANLIELQLLSQIVTQKQSANDIRGSIPYLAKMAQIIDNQRLETTVAASSPQQQQLQQQQHTLRLLQADAHRQLGQAYMKIGQYIQAEASLTITIQRLESLLKGDNAATSHTIVVNQLIEGYDLLKECFELLGKPHMVQGMENRKRKYTTPAPAPTQATASKDKSSP